MEQDKKIRQHITAAKGWLSQAEDSLAQENDIQGDLKLMLAQAELRRAQEKNDKKLCVRWFKKLAPGIFACGLALGAIIYAQPTGYDVLFSSPDRLDSAKADEQLHRVEQPVESSEMAREYASHIDEKAAPAERSANTAYLAHEEMPNAVSEPQASVPKMAEPPRVEIQPQNVQSGEAPAPDMQKLMQSAGSMLRK